MSLFPKKVEYPFKTDKAKQAARKIRCIYVQGCWHRTAKTHRKSQCCNFTTGAYWHNDGCFSWVILWSHVSWML